MKHKFTRLTSLFLALIMSFSMLLVPANAAFVDVSGNAWYAEAVNYAENEGWMKGVSQNSFAPNAEVTRAMFVTVLARFAEADLDGLQSDFADVSKGTWYSEAVAWAAQQGITSGVSATAFAPNRAISRQDLCTMIARFIEKQGYDLKAGDAKSFNDAADIANYAKDAVNLCASLGLVAGYTDGTFRPTATASRAQTAMILMRLDKAIKGENEEPVPMPARTLSSEEIDGLTVSVDAPEGALPADAVMTVTKIENLDAVQAAVDALEDVEGTALVAADITFFHEGEEFQPRKEVTVTMISDVVSPLEEYTVVHLDVSAQELEDGESFEAEPVEGVENAVNAVKFDADKFSTYVVVGQSRNITVNYGFMEGNNFVLFSSRSISSTSTSFPTGNLSYNSFTDNMPYHYLNYDFPGYTYKETRHTSATGTKIWPVLRRADTDSSYWTSTYNWQYSNYSNTTVNWNTFSNSNNKVYVIYEKKTVAQGSSGDNPDDPSDDPPQVPDLPAGKYVEENGDGTYDITLSVTGVEGSQETVTKASVIVIFDTSASMRWEMSSNTVPSNTNNSRIYIAKQAVKTLASNLLSKTDSDGNKLVQMALIDFNTKASIHEFAAETNVTPNYSSNATIYNAAVDSLQYDGITNWEQSLMLANSLDVSGDAPTYVVFVSDGDPTLHISRRNMSDSDVYSLNRLVYGGDVYGDSSGVGSPVREGFFGASTGGFAPDYWPITQEHYDAAVPEAQAIIAANKEFYTIGLSSSVTRMEDFTDDAYGGTAPAEHYFPATSQAQLTEAFDKIASAVESKLGFTEVSIDDGVTDLTTVETDALTGTPANFVYRRGTNADPSQNDVWTGNDVPQADITDDNHVIWDIASIGKLEPGVTYSVTFTIWPNQEAYNIIADINNGIIRDSEGNIVRTGTPAEAYAAQPADIRAQIVIKDGVYTLLTNTGANVSYEYNGSSGSGGVTLKTDPGEMALDSSYFGMHKDWSNELPQDSRTANVLSKQDEDGKWYLINSENEWILDDNNNKIQANWDNFDAWKDIATYYVDLIVTKGDADYTEVRLYSDTKPAWTWAQMFIAPGVMTHSATSTSGPIVVRETGDDYSVREKPSDSYYWELSAETYHPMVINGETVVLKKLDENDSQIPDSLKSYGSDSDPAPSTGLTNGFYLIGPNWTVDDINANNAFVRNPSSQDEYMLLTTLTEGDQLKVVKVENGSITGWYPNGEGNEYTVDAAHAGDVAIYFKENGDSSWSGFGGYVWIAKTDGYFDGDYYVFGGEYYKKLGSANDAMISAKNERRSYLNLTKTVTGTDKVGYDPDAYFTYTVKMENVNGLYQGATGYTANNDDFWFSVYNPNMENEDGTLGGTVLDEDIVTGADRELGSDNAPTGYWHFANVAGGKDGVTVKIKAGWNVRFINLLSGTTYEFVENKADMPDGFTFNKVEATAKFKGQLQTYNPTVTAADQKITGVIEAANTDYTVTYTNDYLGVFYVYHSSDNTVERFPMAVDGEKVTSFDIAHLTADGTLYGGYYDDYAGKSSTFVAKNLTYTDGKSTDAGEGAKHYDAAYIKSAKSSGGVWTSTAYTRSGLAMEPVADTVYYLKEVPADLYLRPYLHYSYYKDTNEIATVWLMSDTDDLKYQEAGFVIIEANKKATDVVSSLTVTTQHGGSTVKLTPKTVFGATGYLSYRKVNDVGAEKLLKDDDSVLQYWVTPDGLRVTGTASRTYTGLASKDSIGKTEMTVDSTITLFTTSD